MQTTGNTQVQSENTQITDLDFFFILFFLENIIKQPAQFMSKISWTDDGKGS